MGPLNHTIPHTQDAIRSTEFQFQLRNLQKHQIDAFQRHTLNRKPPYKSLHKYAQELQLDLNASETIEGCKSVSPISLIISSSRVGGAAHFE